MADDAAEASAGPDAEGWTRNSTAGLNHLGSLPCTWKAVSLLTHVGGLRGIGVGHQRNSSGVVHNALVWLTANGCYHFPDAVCLIPPDNRLSKEGGSRLAWSVASLVH